MNRLLKEQVVKTVLAMIHEGTPVTMDKVAFRCGVSKGTVYNYFKNKKDLLNTVHEAVIIPIKKGSNKIFEKNIPPMEKIYGFVGNVFDFQKEYPLYFKFIQSQRSAADAVTERMEVIIIPLVNVCREGMRAPRSVCGCGPLCHGSHDLRYGGGSFGVPDLPGGCAPGFGKTQTGNCSLSGQKYT